MLGSNNDFVDSVLESMRAGLHTIKVDRGGLGAFHNCYVATMELMTKSFPGYIIAKEEGVMKKK